MEKECECYEEEIQPYQKTDYKPIIYKKHLTQENKDNYNKYKNSTLSKQRKAERVYHREQFDLHQTYL